MITSGRFMRNKGNFHERHVSKIDISPKSESNSVTARTRTSYHTTRALSQNPEKKVEFAGDISMVADKCGFVGP